MLTGIGLHGFWSGIFPLMIVMARHVACRVAAFDRHHDRRRGQRHRRSVRNQQCDLAHRRAHRGGGDGSGGNAAPGFGEPTAGLSAELDAARMAASETAFSTVAWITATLCLLSAITAWLTVSGEAVKDARPQLRNNYQA